jgi:hypothetical protein
MTARIHCSIIGAQKAGTTTLFDHIARHRQICTATDKEIPFFGFPELFARGADYLHDHYRPSAEHTTWLHSATNILASPQAIAELREYNPNIRIIVMMRNPVDRAYSAYWHARRHGFETANTFEEALEREPARRRAGGSAARYTSYLAYGDYAAHLQTLLEQFQRHQVRLLLTEDLRADAARVVGETLGWLGLPPLAEVDAARRSNVAAMPRLYALQRLFMAPPEAAVKRVYRRVVHERARRAFRENVSKRFFRWNLRPFRYPPMREDTRRRLADHFAEPNVRLEKLLERDLSHWS